MSQLNQSPSPEPNPLDDQPPQVGLDEQQYRDALCQLLERIEALPQTKSDSAHLLCKE